MARTCSSAADSPGCTGKRDCGTFRSRRGAAPTRATRRTVLAALVPSLRPVIVEPGLADERELTEVDQAVRAHLADLPHRGGAVPVVHRLGPQASLVIGAGG
jgi:hypothetical protein